jgi:hypothetical protein
MPANANGDAQKGSTSKWVEDIERSLAVRELLSRLSGLKHE